MNKLDPVKTLKESILEVSYFPALVISGLSGKHWKLLKIILLEYAILCIINIYENYDMKKLLAEDPNLLNTGNSAKEMAIFNKWHELVRLCAEKYAKNDLDIFAAKVIKIIKRAPAVKLYDIICFDGYGPNIVVDVACSRHAPNKLTYLWVDDDNSNWSEYAVMLRARSIVGSAKKYCVLNDCSVWPIPITPTIKSNDNVKSPGKISVKIKDLTSCEWKMPKELYDAWFKEHPK